MRPVRVLLLSDIHGDLQAVRQLRTVVDGPFDAVVVAGDIAASTGQIPNPWFGGAVRGHTIETTKTNMGEILATLTSYGCPVCYVLGNHDGHIGYEVDFGPGIFHLQSSPVVLDDIIIAGFSGCDPVWEGNPYWLAQCSEANETLRGRTTLDANRYKVAEDITRHATSQRARLVVTHDRLTNCSGLFPIGTVFVNGHAHGSRLNGLRAAYRVINPGSLLQDLVVVPAGESPKRGWKFADCRAVSMGRYAILEIAPAGLVSVHHMRMTFDREKWREATAACASELLPMKEIRTEPNTDVGS